MLRRFFVAAGLVAAAGLAVAQGAYPTKPVTMIVPFPPGGLADIVGRPVAEAMTRELGQPVRLWAEQLQLYAVDDVDLQRRAESGWHSED